VIGPGALATAAVELARRADTWWGRRLRPDARHVVFDARTAMEYAMMAPLHRALTADRRVRLSLMSSERPDQVGLIYRDATPGASVLSPRAALASKVDAYVAADLLWATLPRGARRIQVFHGVAGKYGDMYDRPDTSMRHWHRLFFINRRRMQNFVASGAVDAGSPAARLVGMPKVDCLVDGSLRRDAILSAHGIDPASRTVLYAPTWTPFSSLNAHGEALVEALGRAGLTVLVKLHENSRDPRAVNSGGVDWIARLRPILERHGGVLVHDSDASRWLVAADVLVTDHSSVGFEYLLLDRPLVRIEMPELLRRTSIPPEYVALMAQAATTAHDAASTLEAVERGIADPRAGSRERRAVAEDLFHAPGTATARALGEMYAVLELEAPAHAQVAAAPAANGLPGLSASGLGAPR
jgi:hypothetical protein